VQLGEGVEWAVHTCTVLALVPEGQVLPASKLAEFHELPPAYLAKHLQSLASAGIVQAVPGRRGGYRLARPAAEISVLSIVQAIEGHAPAFRCTEVRQRGPAAVDPALYTRTCAIARVMWAAEAAWRETLAATSVLDLIGEVASVATPVAIRRTAEWFQEAVRGSRRDRLADGASASSPGGDGLGAQPRGRHR
jgi:Rrf2 family protein